MAKLDLQGVAAQEDFPEEVIVLRPGTKVSLGGGLDAKILRVMIEPLGAVRYELSWISGGDRKVEWVYDFEIRPGGEEPESSVGFRPAYSGAGAL